MRGNPAASKGDGDGGVYSVSLGDKAEQEPLLDLRTRLVLWLLCLAFFGLVYWGVRTPVF